MRNRSWAIILLVAWIGQWVIGAPETLPAPRVSKGAAWSSVENLSAPTVGHPVPGVLKAQSAWLSAENLAELVVYQARRRALRKPLCPHSHRRRRRGGGRPSSRRARVRTTEEERETQREQARQVNSDSVLDPQRWGLSPELSQELPKHLHSFWERYAECFKTKTRDTSEYAYHYLSALLRLKSKRNYANIGRAVVPFQSHPCTMGKKIMPEHRQAQG